MILPYKKQECVENFGGEMFWKTSTRKPGKEITLSSILES